MKVFDCMVVADSRFSGGSTAALVTDVTAMSELGLNIGLSFVRSAYLDDVRDRPNPKALALVDLPGVTLHSIDHPATALITFLHHPLVFARGIEEQGSLSADRTVIVTHHLPFRADGSLEYNPIEVILKVRRSLGLSAWFAPVSGRVRTQIAAFAPFVRQTSFDWPNVFDVSDWVVTRRPFSGSAPIVIGRHGRSDPLKFPSTGADIDAALPAGSDIEVRVLGCPSEALTKLGAHPDRWDVLAFGSEPVLDFLNSLDVFVYHYHPRLNEAFGRTVVEAGLCGRPLLLDPRMRETFGDFAEYCDPVEVADCIARIASNPKAVHAKANDVRSRLQAMYASETLKQRYNSLLSDPGTTNRGMAAVAAPRTAKKLIGHYRRRFTVGTS